MNKVVRDGRVAVIISQSYGLGWYSHYKIDDLLYDPKIVRMLENPDENEDFGSIMQYCSEKYQLKQDNPNHWGGRIIDLGITWVPEGAEFIVHDYDGLEEVWIKDRLNWKTA